MTDCSRKHQSISDDVVRMVSCSIYSSHIACVDLDEEFETHKRRWPLNNKYVCTSQLVCHRYFECMYEVTKGSNTIDKGHLIVKKQNSITGTELDSTPPNHAQGYKLKIREILTHLPRETPVLLHSLNSTKIDRWIKRSLRFSATINMMECM